ncbi:MAG: translation elongation factor Ts [Holosporales bacterium]|jgi:elongation factor Ts
MSVVISAAQVRDLREKTGAGMLDCKKALEEAKGDLEAAVDWLRKKGLSAAAKKAGRVAAEGLVAVVTAATSGLVLEVNAETDFVARNEQFQGFCRETAQAGLDKNTGDIEALKTLALAGGKTVIDTLTGLVATIGENMSLRRVTRLSVNQGVVVGYVHNDVAPGLGKIGVLVALESSAATDKLNELGKNIALHVAATAPQALDISSVDPQALERERNVLAEQARASGKPEEIISKMVDGRVRKYYEEVVLLEQPYVRDDKLTIRALVEQQGKTLGSSIKVAGFARFFLGEGIEKESKDFAAEVAQQLAG